MGLGRDFWGHQIRQVKCIRLEPVSVHTLTVLKINSLHIQSGNLHRIALFLYAAEFHMCSCAWKAEYRTLFQFAVKSCMCGLYAWKRYYAWEMPLLFKKIVRSRRLFTI